MAWMEQIDTWLNGWVSENSGPESLSQGTFLFLIRATMITLDQFFFSFSFLSLLILFLSFFSFSFLTFHPLSVSFFFRSFEKEEKKKDRSNRSR